MATTHTTTLGKILKNEGFEPLLEKLKQLDAKALDALTATSETHAGYEKNVSDLDELLFHAPSYFYKKDEEGKNTQEVASGAFEFIDWALDKGASVNTRMKYGATAFLKAAALPTPDLLQYFIEKCPNISFSEADGRGLDAIAQSVNHSSVSNLEYLASLNQFDINKPYMLLFGKTLLHIACSRGDEIMVDKLLDLGACLTVVDKKDHLPMDYVPNGEELIEDGEEISQEQVEKWNDLYENLKVKTELAQQKEKKISTGAKKYKTVF